MTGLSDRARRRLLVAGIVLGVAVVALVRSASLLGYSNWIMDEQFIVVVALGFIGGDLDPHWFNYHPLPMYLLGTIYYVMYLGARLLDLVRSKPEFVSLLFTHDAVFYVPAKLLGSLAYTAGAAVLGLAAWRRTGSAFAAGLAFFAPLLTLDGILTGYNVRNDSFVFLFAALTVYFACFARKGPVTAMAAVVCCAAAVASKIPAVVLVPVLFAQLALDARAGHLRWRHVGYGALLFAGAAFLFNPFAVLDFSAYQLTLHKVSARVGGEWHKVGARFNGDTADRVARLAGAMWHQCGPVAVIGSVLYLACAAARDRTMVLAPLFALAYVTAFTTSGQFDTYWLRPVYPLLFLFPVLLAAQVAALPKVAAFGPRARALLFALLAAGYLATVGGNVPRAVQAMTPPPEDTRITAARWIAENLPAGAQVVEEGVLLHYLPRVFSPHAPTALMMSGYSLPFVRRNRVLMEGFEHYYLEALRTRKPFRVGAMNTNERIDYDMSRIRLPAGAYVVLSDRSYARYYRPALMRDRPELARNARAFFAFIRAQEPVRIFEGNGPKLEIYRLREGLNMPTEQVPAPE